VPTGAVWLVLGVLFLLAAYVIWHETRGTTLWLDEWDWALYRRGSSLGTFLHPHNQHLSLVPIAIYKLLFASAGLGDHRPYRILIILAHLGCSLLVFLYARPRVGSYFALVASALILFFGPGWQNILWPFQIGWLISVGAGLGALLMIDRRDRTGDIAASGLLVLSLASSGIGVPFALGLAVEVAIGADRRRRAWVVAGPLLLYAIWWIVYQTSQFTRHNILLTPAFVAKTAGSSLSALLGLGVTGLQTGPDTSLQWGPPLLIAALVFAGMRLRRIGLPSARLWALGAMAASFWILTALSRASLLPPSESRYVYVGALFILLFTVELLRGVRVSIRVQVLVGVVAIGAVVSNLGGFREAGRFLRNQGTLASADLGALDIGRPVVGPGYIAQSFPSYPLVAVSAHAYYSAEAAFGTPAYRPSELAAAPEQSREEADAELTRMHAVGPRAVPPGLTARGSCTTIRPSASAEFTLPVVITTKGGSATLSVRRFADQFPQAPVATLRANTSTLLRIAPDRATQPWHVRVAPSASATVCGLG
jgi:hypothetical protein